MRHSNLRDLAARALLPVALLLAAANGAGADSVPPSISDPGRRDVLPQSPGVVGGALGGLANPAAWATASDFAFWWNDDSFEEDALDNWGLSFAGPLGFSAERRTFGSGSGRLRVHDYQIGVAFGDRESHGGFAWRWSSGDDGPARRDNGFSLGWIGRPNRRLSLGAMAFFSVETTRRHAVVDAGFRPLRSPHVTIFGDYSLTGEQRPGDGIWSAGVELRPLPGVHVGARLREEAGGSDLETVLNFGLTLGGLGTHVLVAYDANEERGTTSYFVRTNTPYRGLPLGRWVPSLAGPERFDVIDLQNKRITYQRDRWFDEERVAWIDLARRIRRAREDSRVRGIAIHLSGTRIGPAILWELRRELELCQQSGKRVAIHFDRLRMGGYYLASVADRVTIDPLGHVAIPGIAMHRTYMAGLLEKLGIGFEENRYFAFKSANETYSRSDMSASDREQLGRIVDSLYEGIRDGICASRGLTTASFDALVEEKTVLLPEEALEAGLVDEIARFDDVREWIKEQGARPVATRRTHYPDERWGKPPTVALVYANGICAMDSGIRGRKTSAHLTRLSKRKEVAAVVVRADSPGGSPLPADLVAEAEQKVRESGRPLVVSQGSVAASGGYWISMGADRVFTTPFTLTGSIGVISGWAWDAGVGEKTGFSADGIQRGSRADLFTGIRFPFVPERLPGRPLDEDEKERVKMLTLDLYDRFVDGVSVHRGMTGNEVREIAAGRVWIGNDAIDRGLCDETGTLLEAIDEARALAGLDPDEEFSIEEYPPRRRFRIPDPLGGLPAWSRLALRLAGAGLEENDGTDEIDYAIEYFRSLVSEPGRPMLLVPPEAVPAGWVEP